MACVALLGGLNADVLGHARGALVPSDSNIGSVTLRAGGVAHNVAARLAALGHRALLLAPKCRDALGEWLRARCAEEGIDLSCALSSGAPSPVYMAIHGADGDMALALNDTRAVECLLDRDWLAALGRLPGVDGYFVDTNLSGDSLKAVMPRLQGFVLLDPVSVEKAGRAGAVLPCVTAIKPNLLEARAMTGERAPADCARALLRRGVRQAFISLGADGVYALDARGGELIPPEPFPHLTLTGAGDAMCAGLIDALLAGESAIAAARHGQAVARQFLEVKPS